MLKRSERKCGCHTNPGMIHFMACCEPDEAAPNPVGLDALLKRAAKHEMTPEERRLQKLSFVRGMTGMTDAEILAVSPDLRPCPTCTTLRAQLQSAAADDLAIDGQAMELMAEVTRLKARVVELEEVRVLDSDQMDVTDKLTDLQNERDWAIEAQGDASPELTRLRTALAAVTRATTLMEASRIAESAAGGGSVGCATLDVVGSDIERTS